MSDAPFDPWKELRQRGREALVLVSVHCGCVVTFLLFLWLAVLFTGHTPR